VVKLGKNTFDKRVEITAHYIDGEASVLADPTQIEQVLLNLCVNAAHAMTIMRQEGEAQGGKLNLNIEKIHAGIHFLQYQQDVKPGEYWHISISDTGIGIPKEALEKIFNPFYTTKKKGVGTGLGLAMVNNIIKQHKGFIQVYSEVGYGTNFNLYLPVHKGDSDSFATAKEVYIYTGEGVILVVDDDKVIRRSTKAMLETCGYQVILAHDGVEGVEVLKKRHKEIDLVILDMVMPKLSGNETFIKMKKIQKDVKVLLNSGFRRDNHVEDALRRGAKGFLKKPYTLEKLSEYVYKILHS